MDDKELDEILDEIKQHSAAEKEAAEAPAEEPVEEAPVEEAAEEIPAEEPAQEIAEETPEEAPADEPVEEAPAEEEAEEVEEAEEIAEEEAPEADDETQTFTLTDDDEAEADEEPAEDGAEETEADEETEAEETDAEEGAEEESIDILAAAAEDEAAEEGKKPLNKKVVWTVSIIVLLICIGVAAYFGLFYKGNEPEPTTAPTTTTEVTTEAPAADINPLTGESGFNLKAIGKRPVAVVVENEYGTASVKPQWGIKEADMVMEAETEFSTRMLFFWADYTALPEQIGPARSARPPFIRFSQLFDSVFIHAGLSHSKDNYEGADTVFKNENVDHVNLLSEGSDYFSRDYSRTKTIEHTGFFKGQNAASLIKKYNFRTKLKTSRFTQFAFNESAQPLGTKTAKTATFKWSNACPKKGVFTYDETKHKYVTKDFDSQFGTSEVQFENLIYLLDSTEYIVKQNYKGSGKSETYCNYNLTGGTGAVLSEGTYVNIKWSVKNGKIVMKTTDGQEVKLNPGKVYIGYGSANHNGTITIE